MPAKTSKQTAAERYAAQRIAIEEAIAQLRQRLDNHMDCINPDTVNWGHVGDLNYVMDSLNEIVDFLPSAVV